MLKGFKASNFGVSTLQAAIAPTTTVLEVALNDAAKFPTLAANEWFMLTLGDLSGNVHEIVKCTSVSGNLLTVIRGQENTVAQSWPSGTNISTTVTAGILGEIAEQLERTPATINTRDLTFPEPSDGKGVGWAGTALANVDFATKSYVQNEISGAVGVSEAPNDGVAYVRRNASWTSGDTRYPLLAGSSAVLPAGASSTRPANPSVGATRVNTEIGAIEWWDGTAWRSPVMSVGGELQNAVVWADDAGDLGGGSGYGWPGLYFKSASNTFTFLDKINAGVAFKTIPASAAGAPSAFSFVASDGTNAAVPSITLANLAITAGVVVILISTESGSYPPTVTSVTHAALSGQTTLLNAEAYNTGSRASRVTAYQFVSGGGTSDLVINFSGNSWVTYVEIWRVDSTSIGSFLGSATGTTVSSGSSISVSRTDANAAIDICIGNGVTGTPSTWSASRNGDTLVAPNFSSYVTLVSTTASGSISGLPQTFTINPGTFNGATAFILQWAAPAGPGADYIVSENDLGRMLLCSPGTSNLILPVLTLPNGSDANGPTGIEHYLIVEIPPSAIVTFTRGTGAELWSGYGSGDVSSFVVTTTTTQRKRVVLAARHPNLWQVTAGEVI